MDKESRSSTRKESQQQKQGLSKGKVQVLTPIPEEDSSVSNYSVESKNGNDEKKKEQKNESVRRRRLGQAMIATEVHCKTRMAMIVWRVCKAYSSSTTSSCNYTKTSDLSSILRTIWGFYTPFILTCPTALPPCDTPIQRVCSHVLAQSMLALMECLLLDVSVIVTSDHTWLLTDTCETLMSMMYPFKMKYSLPEYFPLVPADADVETRLDSPFNFCLGVRKDHLVRFCFFLLRCFSLCLRRARLHTSYDNTGTTGNFGIRTSR